MVEQLIAAANPPPKNGSGDFLNEKNFIIILNARFLSMVLIIFIIYGFYIGGDWIVEINTLGDEQIYAE